MNGCCAMSVDGRNSKIETYNRHLSQRMHPLFDLEGERGLSFDKVEPSKDGKVDDTYEAPSRKHKKPEFNVLRVVASCCCNGSTRERFFLFEFDRLVIRIEACENQQRNKNPQKIAYMNASYQPGTLFWLEIISMGHS